MKSKIALLAFFISLPVFGLVTGQKAPDFTLASAGTKDGKVSLSEYKGKIIVLEWLNHGCPFVRKHYDSGNMQNLQSRYTSRNVIWLSIISSGQGKQGFVDPKKAREDMIANKSAATNVLLDPEGTVGHLYGAKTTPHFFVINKDGILSYQGAIDDKPDTDRASIPLAKNYMAEALDLILAGKPVQKGTTKAYGCSVKYK